MKTFINILFYIFGIFLPLCILLVSLVKKKKNIKLFNKLVISVIIFLIFYMLKLGGISLLNKKNDNKLLNTTITTSTTTSNTSTTTTTSKTTKEITTTAVPTTTIAIQKNEKTEAKYIDGILIVNKSYPLPKDFVPENTYKSASGLNYCSTCIDNKAYEQYKLMKADATSLGLNIWIQSGYRSYELQKSLYNKYVNRDGKEAADTYSARPGHSEHQTGLAFDLNTITDDFQYTDEGKWVNDNCYKYGYILRYPKGKEKYTGYKYESWHLRYVGVELATKLYNNGDWITLEEHFNLTSEYSN